MNTWQDVESALGSSLAAAGFDVLGAATVGAYNATLESRLQAYRLPDTCGDDALVLVIGNTRRLWPLFLDAHVRGAETGPGDAQHPLDAYTRRHVQAAVTQLAGDLGVRHALRFVFDRPPDAVALQRLAALAGVAEIAPIGLCIHPRYGPWISLRAAAVFDVRGPASHAAAPTCSHCAARPCLDAREQAFGSREGAFAPEDLDAHWTLWLALRDACPVGREYRFSAQQIRYHYLKQPGTLNADPGEN